MCVKMIEISKRKKAYFFFIIGFIILFIQKVNQVMYLSGIFHKTEFNRILA